MPFEKEMLLDGDGALTGRGDGEGCDETLPLEPLKLSAVVERLMLPLLC